MTERGTRAQFAHWMEPHLTAMTRYAGRRVIPADRDDVVQAAMIRAWQRWSTYDETRGRPVAWVLGLTVDECRSHASRQAAREVVELVDVAISGVQDRDVDLERAVEGLGRRDRLAVDLHYFVGLDAATAAEVMHCTPGAVEATLHQARDRLRELLGAPMDDPMGQRLSDASLRWQEEQPPPPDIPIQRLDQHVRRNLPSRRAVAAAAAAVLVGAGALAVVGALSGVADRAPGDPDPSPTPGVHRAAEAVPFRDLAPGHPVFGHDLNGAVVTPYDDVSATGHISGTLHPGDTLLFDAILETSGLVSLRPCPDYTITFGADTTTRRLNCAQVPYYASLVRSKDQVTTFRPVLPAGTAVVFRMRVTVPDEPGRQKVRWSLEGPHEMPGFDGIVDVTR